MIYFDNAATSFPKPISVVEEITRCMKNYGANPGRGSHAMSIKSGKAVFETRERLASLFNISSPMRICFTKNATEALNIGIRGFLNFGDHVITTRLEHNSVLRPLSVLKKEGMIETTIIKCDALGYINLEEIRKAIRRNTKLIVATISSNVNGAIIRAKELGKIAQENGVKFLLDASQGAGCIDIDVKEMAVDLMAFPGHKGLLGPQGTGGIFVKEGIVLKPIMYGGTGSDSRNFYQPTEYPDYLEAGTLNTPGIVGLGAAIKFVTDIGVKTIREHKYFLTNKFIKGIRDMSGMVLYSDANPNNNSGIVAFNWNKMDATEFSFRLDKVYGIETRAGLHCAPLMHETLGTIETGAVRVSFSFFNSEVEVDCALDAIKEILKTF